MNHFLNLGSTVQGGVGPKMAIFLPIMTKHGELFNVAKWSKTAQNVQLDLFGPFQAKFNFPLKRTSAKEPYVFSGHCFYFWLKSSKRVQMDTLWFQIMNNLYISRFGPFWILSDHFATLTNLSCLAIFGTPPFPNITSPFCTPSTSSITYNSPFFISPTCGRLMPGSHWSMYVVDCPTQLICTWIFICSMTKLKEHSREIC